MMVDMFLNFHINYSSFLLAILLFDFYLVHSECGAYLEVDSVWFMVTTLSCFYLFAVYS